MCALNSELMCVRVCYIKDEQKSLRPDADVAIWPLTLIGVCVCVCVYVCVRARLQRVKERCSGEGDGRSKQPTVSSLKIGLKMF